MYRGHRRMPAVPIRRGRSRARAVRLGVDLLMPALPLLPPLGRPRIEYWPVELLRWSGFAWDSTSESWSLAILILALLRFSRHKFTTFTHALVKWKGKGAGRGGDVRCSLLGDWVDGVQRVPATGLTVVHGRTGPHACVECLPTWLPPYYQLRRGRRRGCRRRPRRVRGCIGTHSCGSSTPRRTSRRSCCRTTSSRHRTTGETPSSRAARRF